MIERTINVDAHGTAEADHDRVEIHASRAIITVYLNGIFSKKKDKNVSN